MEGFARPQLSERVAARSGGAGIVGAEGTARYLTGTHDTWTKRINGIE